MRRNSPTSLITSRIRSACESPAMSCHSQHLCCYRENLCGISELNIFMTCWLLREPELSQKKPLYFLLSLGFSKQSFLHSCSGAVLFCPEPLEGTQNVICSFLLLGDISVSTILLSRLLLYSSSACQAWNRLESAVGLYDGTSNPF